MLKQTTEKKIMDLESNAKSSRLSNSEKNSGNFINQCKMNSKKKFVWENRLQSKCLFVALY